MEMILNLIEGAVGAIFMAGAGLLTIFSLVILVPIFIMKDEKLLMGKRAYNIAYGLGALFFFPLALGYCFFHWKGIRKPLLIGASALVVAVLTFVVRSAVGTFFTA